MPPLVIAGAIAAAAAVSSAEISSNAASNAADTQAGAAKNALSLQKYEFDTQQQNLAPWLQAGTSALGALEYGLGINSGTVSSTGGMTRGQLTTPYPSFQYGAAQFQTDPGYQFRLSQGMQALQSKLGSGGTALGGAAAQSAIQYGQGFASNEYSNAYNRALQTYGTNFNTAQQNRSNILNPLMSVAQMGQSAVSQSNQASQNYANQGGNYLTQAANAQAAGTVGSANALTSGISSGTNDLLSAYLMSQSLNNQSQYNSSNVI